MHLSLKKIINPPIPLAALLIIVCAAAWCVHTTDRYFDAETLNAPLAVLLQKTIPNEWFVRAVICLLLTFGNGLLLWQLNNRFTLIRERTFLLFFTFLVLLSFCESTHYIVVGHLTASFIIASFFIFLDMYHRQDATEAAFLGSFLVAVAGLLLLPPVLLLFVPVWIGFVMMRAFSLRTFLASLVGLIAPAFLCFATKLIDVKEFANNFTNIFVVWSIESIKFSISQSVYFSTLLLLFLLALIGIYTSKLRDVVHTRINLNFMVVFWFFSIGIAVLYFHFLHLLLPLIVAPFAIIFSQPVSLRNNTYFTVLFYIFCGINLLYFLYHILY
jgi:hypothetical protein